MKLTGVILLIVGVIALVYGGIRYTTHKREVDMGPIQINKTEHHTIPMPPLLGAVCIVAGGALVFAGGRAKR
ncbi:MAG TPA: hypothetical protein VMW15_09680 [Terracidiphilus sp.]|nr:hypothetical protein [Terracidiphilus sp.]